MKRSRQRNKFLNIKSDLDRKAYNKQRNMWLIYREKKKTNFMVIFNGNFLNRKQDFGETVKPFLAEKSKKVSIIRQSKLSHKNKQIAKIFNEYFISIPILNMPANH